MLIYREVITNALYRFIAIQEELERNGGFYNPSFQLQVVRETLLAIERGDEIEFRD